MQPAGGAVMWTAVTTGDRSGRKTHPRMKSPHTKHKDLWVHPASLHVFIYTNSTLMLLSDLQPNMRATDQNFMGKLKRVSRQTPTQALLSKTTCLRSPASHITWDQKVGSLWKSRKWACFFSYKSPTLCLYGTCTHPRAAFTTTERNLEHYRLR